MSESSSDTESSCGWTIINNEGSDIENLGPENGGDSKPDTESLEEEAQEETQEEVQEEPSVLKEERTESWAESSHDATLTEEALEQTEAVPEAGRGEVVDERITLCSSSDHSDIVTLEPSAAAEPVLWEEPAEPEERLESTEELYLGSSSSSQYAFSTVDTAPPLPVEPLVRDSSSSEDEEVQQPGPTLRRRRVRRSTSTTSETEEAKGSGAGEQDRQEEQEEQHTPPPQGHVSGTLNKCILLALIIAVSMGFGHFYGTIQIQERQKTVEKLRESELSDMRGGLRRCQGEHNVIEESKEVVQHLREDLEEKRGMVLSLTGIMDKITKENHQLRLKQAELQAQKEELAVRLKQSMQERSEMESHQKHLAMENQQLKSSLEREEQSLSALQEELRYLRAQIRNLEERGAGADSILTENQRLKGHLEEEKQRARGFLSQKEALMAEAHALRRELDKERRATEQLKEELDQLSSQSAGIGGQADPEMEELQLRLMELEKKLNFEQQRSDLWERLYVETREERAKGDKQARAKKPRGGIIGKVKETFDAVKNSTKEFVHHHKEQIKKAKEAVKENLRKFSDSVKSTFRRFKNSAAHMFDKSRRSQERKEARAERQERQQERSRQPRRDKDSDRSSWQPRSQKPLHRHPRKSTSDTFQGDRNTQKPGPNTRENSEPGRRRGRPKGCSGVFDCAHQESMSLFNKALEPIREDEFNQLLHRYLQQEVNHFHHWRELESFINNFFQNGVFIHDQMLFTDFVSGVEDYLEDIDEYQRYDDDVFEDLDDYIYKHFFGDTYSKRYGPSRPIEKPATKSKEDKQSRQHRKQQAHPRPQRDRKWSRPGRPSGRPMANVKIELGPMPFDPKY